MRITFWNSEILKALVNQRSRFSDVPGTDRNERETTRNSEKHYRAPPSLWRPDQWLGYGRAP
jgi:hypothetical protein